MRNLIDILDFTTDEINDLLCLAEKIIKNPKKFSKKCNGKKLATLFFEPSTRTRLSFEAAMLELGGSVLGFSEASSSSATKGESVADTAKIISCYADIIAMRHPLEGAPLVASLNASVPVINAGDGGHHHPTQTLTDLLTIHREKGGFDGLTIGFCGDLLYGRTVHSLISALSRYKNINFVLISPDELKIPDYIKSEILDNKELTEKNNLTYIETSSLEESIDSLDILYMTRIQKERFDDLDKYERLKDSYVLNPEKLALAKKDMKILHPLPRVNEISVDVDSDPRACYFKQALNGKYIRQALILTLLYGKDKKKAKKEELIFDKFVCENEKCITTQEQGLRQIFKVQNENGGKCRCIYCEKEV